MPEFLVKKAAKKLNGFWPKMKKAWYEEFPEELELRLPVQVFDPDPNAPRPRKLTTDEEAALSEAITIRDRVGLVSLLLTNALNLDFSANP